VTHIALTHCYPVAKALFMALGTKNAITNYLQGLAV